MFGTVFLFLSFDVDSDMRNLLERVKQNESKLEAELERFGYHETIDRFEEGKRRTEEFAVTTYKGRRIRRLVARDGKPIEGAELEKENKRIEKTILRMEKGDIPPLSNRRLRVEDLVAAAAFSNIRKEVVQGREVTSFDFRPRSNYKARNTNERFIQNLVGRLWVDASALQLVRADLTLTGPFKIAGGLFFTMKPGTKFFYDQLWFGNEIWLPRANRVTFQAKAMMMKSLNIEQATTYSKHQRFEVSATDTVH